MQLMAANNIGALLVMQDNKLVGILTERDFSRKSYLLDKPLKDTLVKEIMTHQVAYVTWYAINVAFKLMNNKLML